jgi:UDPglucose 6-dehydrogenase
MNNKIGICGIGVVGSAIVKCFEKKKIILIQYDKYKNGGIGYINDLLETSIIFLCLPTIYSEEKKEYDKSSIFEVCNYLSKNKYDGCVVVKSTVEPGTCRYLKNNYNLNILHNPEFLTARTAEEDFENQHHIVIGGPTIDYKHIDNLKKFYIEYWNSAVISISIYEESEIMKIGVNCFYAVKIQFFNEIYALVNTYDNAEYKNVIDMMLKNKWIFPNHVEVPGTDGKLSYGGMCFPKDTNALYQLMIKKETPCEVLGGTISERNKMRK